MTSKTKRPTAIMVAIIVIAILISVGLVKQITAATLFDCLLFLMGTIANLAANFYMKFFPLTFEKMVIESLKKFFSHILKTLRTTVSNIVHHKYTINANANGVANADEPHEVATRAVPHTSDAEAEMAVSYETAAEDDHTMKISFVIILQSSKKHNP